MARVKYTVEVNGIEMEVPSVGKIVKAMNFSGMEGLLSWAAGLGPKYATERFLGADIGAVGHSAIEEFFRTHNPVPDFTKSDRFNQCDPAMVEKAMHIWNGFVTWWCDFNKKYEVLTASSEKMLSSQTLMTAGIADLVTKCRDRVSGEEFFAIVDFKSGGQKLRKRDGVPYFKSYDDSRVGWLTQIAAYGSLFEEMTGNKVTRGIIVHICRDAVHPPEVIDYGVDELQRGLELFTHTRKAFGVHEDVRRMVR